MVGNPYMVGSPHAWWGAHIHGGEPTYMVAGSPETLHDAAITKETFELFLHQNTPQWGKPNMQTQE